MARPVKYSTVEEMEEAIDVYFAECDPHFKEVDYIEAYSKFSLKKYRPTAARWDLTYVRSGRR
jgi:hypothetical protein